MENDSKVNSAAMLAAMAAMGELPVKEVWKEPKVNEKHIFTEEELAEIRSLPKKARKARVAELKTLYYQRKHAKVIENVAIREETKSPADVQHQEGDHTVHNG